MPTKKKTSSGTAVKKAPVKKTEPRTYAGLDAEKRRQARKQQLIQAGLEAFGTQGYSKSSIKLVCQLANLTERYFYESFSNKEALLIAVYDYLIDQIKEDFASILAKPDLDNQEKAYQSLEMFYQRLRDDPYRAQIQLFEVLGVSDQVNQSYQHAMRELANYILLLFDLLFPGIKNTTTDPNIMATAISGAIIQVGEQWVLNNYKQPLEEFLPTLLQGFFILGSNLENQ